VLKFKLNSNKKYQSTSVENTRACISCRNMVALIIMCLVLEFIVQSDRHLKIAPVGDPMNHATIIEPDRWTSTK